MIQETFLALLFVGIIAFGIGFMMGHDKGFLEGRIKELEANKSAGPEDSKS